MPKDWKRIEVECPECHEIQRSKTALNEHLKIHVNFKCEGCSIGFSTHRRLVGHRARCDKYRSKVADVITKDFLNEWLIDKKESVNFIQTKVLAQYGIEGAKIYPYAKRFGIPMTSYSDGRKASEERRSATNIKRYGATNPLGYGSSAAKKRDETVLRKYGVTNVFAAPEIIEKIQDTMLERYGARYVEHVPGMARHNAGQRSNDHKKVEAWLTEYEINFRSEVRDQIFKMFNILLDKEFMPRPDIVLVDINVIIEIYGDKYHANPELYLDSDIIITWKGEKTASDIHVFDKIREEHLKKLGFRVICIWGSHIRCSKRRETKERLLTEVERCLSLQRSNPSKRWNLKTATMYL